MLLGIRLLAHPTEQQKIILSQWMGCSKLIWNAKCEDERYMTQYAVKYCPIKTYAPIDQSYSQYKNKELTPYLFDCPSQILRNSATNWFDTYKKFIQGECGKPRRKLANDQEGSIHLTRELFYFEKCADGNTRLFIGAKTNNIGYLSVKIHKNYSHPNSIYIKKKNGRYWVSFCYGEKSEDSWSFNKDNLEWLKNQKEEFLIEHTVGIDRGVAIPVQAGDTAYNFTYEQQRKKEKYQKRIKHVQKNLSRKKYKSNRYNKNKLHLAKKHQKIANINQDFCHKTSHSIVSNPKNKIIILEDLKTKNMTKKPAPKIATTNPITGTRTYAANKAAAKAGLNQAILDKGWYRIENFIKYKSQKFGKAFFKIAANGTSQECAACGHTHSDNRKTQAEFICQVCNHSDNADHNAALVIIKRAIKLLLHPGTGLSKRGVLTPNLDIGRGAKSKTQSVLRTVSASGKEASKKKICSA